jgi:hypothetical protein
MTHHVAASAPGLVLLTVVALLTTACQHDSNASSAGCADVRSGQHVRCPSDVHIRHPHIDPREIP